MADELFHTVVKLVDPDLLFSTGDMYAQMVEEGEMTPEEAQIELEALLLGMLVMEVPRG